MSKFLVVLGLFFCFSLMSSLSAPTKQEENQEAVKTQKTPEQDIPEDFQQEIHQESLLIKQYPKLFKRNQDLLTAFVQNGKSLVLENNHPYGDDSISYYWTAFFPQINCSAVKYIGWEISGYVLVNHYTGETLISNNLPFISPSAQRFVLSDTLNDYEEIPASLIIYKNTKGAFTEEFSHHFQERWSASKLTWLSDREIKFTKMYRTQTSPGTPKLDSNSQINAKLINGKWQVCDEKLCYLSEYKL